MSLTASAPHPAARHGGTSPASRVLAAHPTQGRTGAGAAAADSPFAQWLQGAVDDEPDASRTCEADTPDDADAGTDEPHAAASRKKDDPAAAGTDTTATPTPTPTPDAAPADLAQCLRQAGLAAAVRAKAADTVARGRHAAGGAADAADAADSGQAAGLLARDRGHAGGDASAEAAGAVDIGGFQRVLDATPVNLATATAGDAALATTAAAADFSLPSLGAGGGVAAQPAPEARPAQATLAPPPGSPAFPAALGAQLNTWLQDGVQYATLALNPQDMGPIEVRIALRGGRTQVELGADVAETRAALAGALPALADALGDVGLSLAGGSVSDQTGQHARQGDPQGQRAFSVPGWLATGRDGAEGQAAAAARPATLRGLVDLVA